MKNIYSVFKNIINGQDSLEWALDLNDDDLNDKENERKEEIFKVIKSDIEKLPNREIKGKPLVSIIIVNRETEKLEELIESFQKCKFYDNYEIIIVDALSDGHLTEYVEKWKKKMALTVVNNKKKITTSMMNNAGVKKAKGEYFVFLDNNVIVSDRWLDELLYAYQNLPQAGIVSGRLIYPAMPKDNKNSGNSFCIQSTGIEIKGSIFEDAYFMQPFDVDNKKEICEADKEIKERVAVSGAMMLVSREVFNEIGPFDRKYNLGYESTDLCLHGFYKGYKNYYIPTSNAFFCDMENKLYDDETKDLKRIRKNVKVFKCVWQSYLLRQVIKDKIEENNIFTKNPLKITIIEPENDEKCRDLGESLSDKGYDVEYLEAEKLPHAVGIYTDVIVDGTNNTERSDYTDTRDSVIIVPIEKFDKLDADKFKDLVYEINDYVDPKGIDICGSMPNTEAIYNWGDYHYALALAKSLEKLGYHCTVKTRDEWYERSRNAYSIVLRGKYACYPKIEQKYSIMWNISHPDRVKVEEYNCFDMVYAASDVIEKQLKEKIKVPVKTLMQCTDPEVMTNVNEEAEKKYELLFVGNSRNVFRTILKDLLPTEHKLTVYGDGWDEFPVKDYVEAKYMPNEQVGQAYHDAKILLNDHWDDMKDNGIISNRIFDALAAGAFIISDDMPQLHKYFEGCLVTYRDREDLKNKIDYYLTHEDERKEIVGKGKKIVLRNHTFDARAKEISYDLENKKE